MDSKAENEIGANQEEVDPRLTTKPACSASQKNVEYLHLLDFRSYPSVAL